MLTGKKDTAVKDRFTVLNDSSVRVAGITLTDFTKKLYNPSKVEVSGTIPVTVSEIENGEYEFSYTPNAAGLWTVVIFNTAYFAVGMKFEHEIFVNDIDSLVLSLATMEELVEAIEADLATVDEVATGVWAATVRTLTSFGTLVADIWGYATRTLSAFGFSVAVSDKTGFSLSATGADLILKSSTFIQAIVAAINEFATYGLTALNTLLVSTGIKASSIPPATLADDAITASKFDETTAYPVKSEDAGSTKIARTGADSDTLETLSDQMDVIETDVLAIQNNTDFVAQIAEKFKIPVSSYEVYKIRVCLYDDSGHMEDPDSNDLGLKVDTAAGVSKNSLLYKEYACSTVLGTSAISGHLKLEREAEGVYFCYIKIASTETDAQFMYDFAFLEATVQRNFARTNLVLMEASGVTATLDDSTTNADIIAKALKSRDVSGTSAVSGSVYDDVMDNIDNVASDVWAYSSRTLTAFGTLVADIATAVWGATSRTLSSFGTLVADVASAVWGATTRTLSAFGFSVVVSDKTGFSLTTDYDAAKTAASQTSVNSGFTAGAKEATLTAVALAVTALGTDTTFLKDVEGGDWRLSKPNDLTYYKSDHVTVVARFKCFDIDENPVIDNVASVRRV